MTDATKNPLHEAIDEFEAIIQNISGPISHTQKIVDAWRKLQQAISDSQK